MYWVGRLKEHGVPTEKLESRGWFSSTQFFAKALMRKDSGLFDTDERLVGCKNGVLDLRTRRLMVRPPSIVTMRLGCSYEPDAACPNFDAFVRNIMCDGEAEVRFLQTFMGYLLTGSVKEQSFVIWKGDGSNGKTTLVKVILQLMGEYGTTIPIHSLMRSNSGSENTYELAKLRSKRFVCASEGEAGHALAEARIKLMTGGDKIAARPAYGQPFEFQPNFKLCILTNTLPTVSGTDHGIWRRVKVLPFNRKIPDEEQDRNLDKILSLELPGILNWALEGHQLWAAKGLKESPLMMSEKETYKMDSDTVGRFVEMCCIRDWKSVSRTSDLYSHYFRFTEDESTPLTRARFGRELRRTGFVHKKFRTGNGWSGVRLKTDAD